MITIRFIVGLLFSTVALIISLPVFILGIPIYVVHIMQQVIHTFLRKVRPITVSEEALVNYQPVLGWKPKPGLNTYSVDLAGNRYQLTTDLHGWRKSVNGLQESDVYVFGDSFAFGYGVNDDEFFANVISDPRIKAIGANGYNMVQEYMLMKEYSEILQNKMVVWLVYHGNDLLENLTPNMERYRMPFLREKNGSNDWEIVTSHVNPSYWSIDTNRDYYGKLAEICSDTALSKRAMSACDYLIKKGKELCHQVHAKLCLLSLPDIIQIDSSMIIKLAEMSPDKKSFDPEIPDKELRKSCERYEVPFFTSKEYLAPHHYISGDVHWNREGSRRVGELIKEVYYRYK